MMAVMPTPFFPQDVPIGCPSDVLRTLFHTGRDSYCTVMVFAGLKEVRKEPGAASAVARRAAAAFDAEARQMQADIEAEHLSTYAQHSLLALAAAKRLVERYGDE